jgi:predicted tellurium resistance membrane protein TerC
VGIPDNPYRIRDIVLGIDNVIFISILSDKLPKNQQEKGRKLGLAWP